MGFTDTKGLTAVNQLLLADLAQSIVVSYFCETKKKRGIFFSVRSDRINRRIPFKLAWSIIALRLTTGHAQDTDSVAVLGAGEFGQSGAKEHDLVVGMGNGEDDVGLGEWVFEEAALEESIGANGTDGQCVERVEHHFVCVGEGGWMESGEGGNGWDNGEKSVKKRKKKKVDMRHVAWLEISKPASILGVISLVSFRLSRPRQPLSTGLRMAQPSLTNS